MISTDKPDIWVYGFQVMVQNPFFFTIQIYFKMKAMLWAAQGQSKRLLIIIFLLHLSLIPLKRKKTFKQL